jgi:LacI family transcriptional regulator
MNHRASKTSVTQTELARRLGVSQMTVSRVLNNHPGVKDKTQDRIRRAIKQHGYIPDQIASGLRRKNTRVIGLVIPDVSDSFFPLITKSIEVKAKEHGFSTLLSHSRESYDLECAEINLLRGFRVSGLIIAPSGDQGNVEIYRELQRNQVPFVFIDRLKQDISCSSVVTDVRQGALEIGRYLLKKGFRKWGYLQGPKGVFSSEGHEQGLLASLREPGGKTASLVAVRAGFRNEDGYAAAAQLLNKHKPDVIVAMNDLVAVGAYRYLKENHIKVPEEVALVGFSDLTNMDILEVPLTTVRESTAEIGEHAIDILLQEIDEPNKRKRQLLLKPQLIVRQTT